MKSELQNRQQICKHSRNLFKDAANPKRFPAKEETFLERTEKNSCVSWFLRK